MERPAKREIRLLHRLVLLRLRPRLPQGAGRLCTCRRPHSAAAALCLRRLVVALLGLQRPGTRRTGARLPRERHSPRCAGHRHGLAHQRGSAEGHGRDRSVRPEAGLDRLHLEQGALSRSRCVPQESPRRRAEGHTEPASRFGDSAVGSCLPGDGARHGHRSGHEELRALRPHRQALGNGLLQSGSAPAGGAGHRLLVDRLAAGPLDD